MRVEIRTTKGDTFTIYPVQAIRILDGGRVETQTWGNGPVVQRDVESFRAEFEMPQVVTSRRAAVPAVQEASGATSAAPVAMDRNETIDAIKAALKARSGRSWSVTGGRGTSWGWIRISAHPKRLAEFGTMSDDDCAELSRLLGKTVHRQGESIPAASDYRAEYVARARGEVPAVTGSPYWD